MKTLIKNSFRKKIAGTLIPALFLSFILCCSPSSMAQSRMSMVSPMASDLNASCMSQNDKIKTKICLINLPYCPQCECRDMTAILNDDSSKIVNFSNDKLLSVALREKLTFALRLALIDKSPPKSLQKSIPLYLFDRALRL